MRSPLILLSALLLLLSACSADSAYTTWPCAFAYNNADHLDATLNSAIDPNSPGTFCLITEGMDAGKPSLFFENNHGMRSAKPETYAEQQAKFVLGLNNGIIVGHANGMLNDFAQFSFVAYDQQCPNCVETTGNTINPNFRVVMSSAGIATCSKCGRRYDLNNGGILLNAEQKNEKNLQRYRQARTSGPNGMVSVYR